MIFRSRKKLREEKEHQNRLHLILAIIFLFTLSLIIRLYNLQVYKYDMYTALASDQHEVFNQLNPVRGKIYIQDKSDNDEEKIFPVASNKEFALVYAVPKLVQNEEDVANILYELFDKEVVEKEVDELMEDDEYFASTTELKLTVEDFEKREEFKEIKREKEIELRRDVIVENYFNKLSKPNDPYEPIKRKVDETKLEKLKELKIEGINYIMETHRYYPEKEIGAHFLGFVSFNGGDSRGQYGLEGFFNEELTGVKGSIKAEKSAEGELIIIDDREYTKPKNGKDLILTINRSIQFTAYQKLKKAVEYYDAEGGTVLVMDPSTGAIIAMCSFPDYDPNKYNEVDDINIYNNPAIFNSYEPGSIFKVITMAIGIDQGKIAPGTIYNDKGAIMIEGWDKPIKNSDFETKGAHGWVDMVTVLEESLNTGSIYVMQQTGERVFAEYVRKFGFGEKTGIELETEGLTNIVNLKRNYIRPVEAATASFGQGITATPLQMIVSYSAIANGGIMMKPYLVSEIIADDGTVSRTQPQIINNVISERAALLTSGMMVNVVDGGHAKLAGVDGYYVAGKTGTAQVADMEKGGYLDEGTIHTFVGFAPVEDPKFVMLVKLDKPKNADYSASTAAPVFGEIAEFILNYYQVPRER